MSGYYGTGYHGTQFYGTNYYGPQAAVAEIPVTGGGGGYRDDLYHQNKEDEYVLELVFKKFVEVINAKRL